MLIATLIALLAAQDVPVVERGRVGQIAIAAAAETISREFDDRVRLIDLKLEGHLTPALEIKLFDSQAAASLIAEICRRITNSSSPEFACSIRACERKRASA